MMQFLSALEVFTPALCDKTEACGVGEEQMDLHLTQTDSSCGHVRFFRMNG
jgi:hypothetical protein